MNNKTSKRKVTLIFFLFLLLGAVIGFVLAIGSSLAGFYLSDALLGFQNAFQKSLPAVLILICAASILISCLFLAKAKKLSASWDGEDEETAQRAELFLGRSMTVTSAGLILSFTWFGLICVAAFRDMIGSSLFLAGALVFVLSAIIISFVQRGCVEAMKLFNPEKRGDALELRFQKKWMESCDEQERQAIGQAAYKAFSVLPPLSLGIFVLLALLATYCDIGFLPFLIMGVMWLVPTIVYLKESLRQKRCK